ncbi:MAG TPA: hypothetical protein VFU36_06400 [Jatrophihabitans sp.]|nr:hypothetical protein [Jatrophihabitans sp.]
MSLAAKLRRAPGRMAAGAFILNAGLSKLSGDAETAKALHAMACGSYPMLRRVPAPLFLRLLAAAEIGIGVLLLLPLIGPALAGLALTGFAGGMLGIYLRTPGLHDERFRPTKQGTAIAKDVWLAGIGLSLQLDAALSESPISRRRRGKDD